VENIAQGSSALRNNTTGNGNTATGIRALFENVAGNHNTAVGLNALRFSTGARNIAVGKDAGLSLTNGDDNIYVGNEGVDGEGNAVRIGTEGPQKAAFIAGIRGRTTDINDAVAVVIDSNGQLGTISSSGRLKDDVADMADASSDLMKLRPVTFHYKSDQNPAGRALQYGLIAEEVAAVNPGLVARTKDGRIETVFYQFLSPMLLNEYQKQQRTIDAQAKRIAEMEEQLARIFKMVEGR